MANKRFTSIKNDYCITFDRNTDIQECKDDKQINQTGFSFTTIEQIQNLRTNVTIDVIGIVLQVGQVGTLKLKTGETRDKRNLVIGDDTNLSISVTLWGETATKLDLKPGMMIACKQCKISEFNGKSLNGSSSLSDYVIGNINHVRATAIQKWHSGFSEPYELVN